ncbi:hypothetical protein [Serratia sp. PL7]|uniref:hypothetical protein n=1 Tax=Serratia sp. PL7 TaxID=2952201 RepID=UPI0019E59F87|nr:hypothetical protein [Serratia sp. PL7]MBE0152951.1 hypothetical protein [Serratia fonticola]
MLAHKIYQDQTSLDKLQSMGLSVEDFSFAISRAIYESRRSSPLHPRTSAMSRAWDEVVAAFRESVLSGVRGWNYMLDSGLEYTINSELGLSIIATSGTKDTGLVEGFPKTKNAKGMATENLVSRNLDLFESNDSEDPVDMTIDSTKTYVFLYYFDLSAQEVRCELSLPSGMSGFNGHNKISTWSERIILPSVPFSAAIDTPEKEFNEEIDIVVSRK